MVLSEAQLQEYNRVANLGGTIEPRGDFVVGEGCWPGICRRRWAVLALRISDGAPFVRMSDGTIAMPLGETLPELLRQLNSLGQWP